EVAEYDSEGNLLPPLPVVRTGRPQVEDSDSEEEPPKPLDDGEEEEEEEEEEDDEKKEEKKEKTPEPTEEEKKKKKKKPKKLLSNMFNYADREVLTVNSVTRVSEWKEHKPCRLHSRNCGTMVTQWGIYDAYQRDYAAAVAAKEKEKKEKQIVQRTELSDPNEKSVALTPEESYAFRFFHAVKLMERLVTQNTFEDIAFDAQFYDDPADKYREPEGTLLPLWQFNYEETQGSVVTDIKWSPQYYDMFTASFGTYNVHAFRTTGMVCVYTLKNPSFPEYKFRFKTGCQTVDIHEKEPYYLAVGLYNGFVAIVNIKNEGKPFRLDSDLSKKHVGVVWEVQWCNDVRDRQLGFYSAGSDGRIYKWLVYMHELAMTPVIRLDLNAEVGFTRIPYYRSAYATSLCFKPDDPEIFLVGTAEGMIFKCSISYSSSYLYVYYAHELTVYRIAYNPYFTKVFASASCDWKLKIWEDCKPDPLFIFDLYCAVMDVQWSPYSSTVLAATTSDGRLNLYDLNINQLTPICVQTICYPQSGYTTRLRFNLKLPFILVGDSKGFLVIMKVSPNCRMPTVLGKKKVRGKDKAKDDPRRLELMKFKRIFQYVRERDVLQPVPDVDLRTNEEKSKLVERWMQTMG
ncbi:hypothetical protein GE061_013787, partial [Apolygus lucorum]